MKTAHRINLYKRSNGYYYISYYMDSKRIWQSTGCTTRPEALAYLSEHKPADRRDVPKKSTPLLSEFFTTFKSQADLRQSTIKSYSDAIDRWTELIGDKTIDSYEQAEVMEFRTEVLSTATAQTYNYYHSDAPPRN
jgi:hypothetical protein